MLEWVDNDQTKGALISNDIDVCVCCIKGKKSRVNPTLRYGQFRIPCFRQALDKNSDLLFSAFVAENGVWIKRGSSHRFKDVSHTPSCLAASIRGNAKCRSRSAIVSLTELECAVFPFICLVIVLRLWAPEYNRMLWLCSRFVFSLYFVKERTIISTIRKGSISKVEKSVYKL